MQALYRILPMLFLCACFPEEKPIAPVAGDTYFTIPIADTTLKLQLALSENERRKGLMYRERLSRDHGMLFLFEEPGKRSFWMRNTGIPLDIGYFNAEGVLLEIHSLYPYDENSVHSFSDKVLIAIEVNQNWFARNNIRPGAQLDMKALKTAVEKSAAVSK